uniref:Putative aquaporin major intrinsic protein family n=1 Tax=Xenopsylla cheopis TaxID=163159 RepID=A0A6M2DXF3_XENCH
MLVTGRISILKGLLYMVAQCLGALAGSAALKALTPESVQGMLGVTSPGGPVSPAQALGVEFFLGFVLVLAVFGACDENREQPVRYLAPLSVGLTVTLGHLAAVDYTGSGMNPARAFGSAALAGHWQDHWVYWVGPILGGIAAALLYTTAFTAPKPHVISAPANERYRVPADDKEMKRLDGNNKLEEP